MSNDGKVIDFSEMRKKLSISKVFVDGEGSVLVEAPTTSNEELIHQGLDAFFNQLEEGVTGFITFTFNDAEKVLPEVVIAGEIDPLRAIGALHHTAGGYSHALHMEDFMKRIDNEGDIEQVKILVREELKDEDGEGSSPEDDKTT